MQEKNPLPQLHFEWFPSQIFWLLVSFSLLYLVLSKMALPTIREVLQNRQSRITNDLKKAESFKEEAESIDQSISHLLGDARVRADKLLADARASFAEEETKRHAKLEENFAKQHKESEQRITKMQKQAKTELAPIIDESAALLIEQLAGVKAKAGDLSKLRQKAA